ncbi:MAG: hypothetical protein NTV87_11770 [Ignavibacteriae bacterium]|nr:hypothetical protein [Ignavibacteriota bacterium]
METENSNKSANYNEDDGGEIIGRSYEYSELKEMFEKKFGYRDIDNLSPEDERRVSAEFRKFMEDLGM